MHDALAAEAAALETRARDLMARLDALEKEGSDLARELTGVNHSRQTLARLLKAAKDEAVRYVPLGVSDATRPIEAEPAEAPHA